MRILLLTKYVDHFNYVRSIAEELLKQGAQVTVWFTKRRSFDDLEADGEELKAFQKKYPHFKFGYSKNRVGFMKKPLFVIRGFLNYRRYLVVSGQSPFYRERMLKHMPFYVESLFVHFRAFMDAILRPKISNRFLAWIQSVVPSDKGIAKSIQDECFNVVVGMLGNMQLSAPDVEYIKAAKSLGVPSVFLLKSWDSMTNKGYLYEVPDRIFVWNEAHKHDAQSHHGVDPAIVTVVGAPIFDMWYEPAIPFENREESKKALGLDSAQMIILYLGSSPSSASDDRFIVEGLRKVMDSSQNNIIREALLLVRPHPSNSDMYRDFEMNGVVVMPKNPTAPGTKETQLLALRQFRASSVAIGVNTSAMFEAMVQKTPVISYLVPAFSETQSEAEHFRELEESGAVALVRSDEEALLEFEKIANGKDEQAEARERFLRETLRPRGVNLRVGKIVADEIIALAKSR